MDNTGRIRNWVRTLPDRTSKPMVAGSWIAALGTGAAAAISSSLAVRLALVAVSAVVLAPSLVLALRQVERERRRQTVREQASPAVTEPASEEQSAFVDQETNLASRRYLLMFLEREISRSGRAGAPVCVAVFDVDDYHSLESDAGAEAAVAGLAEIGAKLKSALRDYDMVARYADGRIVAVLPETGSDAAEEVVHRLHELATSVCVDGNRLSVTVGLAAFPDNGRTAEELISSAHRVLNRGKAEAANQVHVHEELRKAA